MFHPAEFHEDAGRAEAEADWHLAHNLVHYGLLTDASDPRWPLSEYHTELSTLLDLDMAKKLQRYRRQQEQQRKKGDGAVRRFGGGSSSGGAGSGSSAT